ncbi:hypothetical protein F7Q92_15985 [Ideonella dechloratans]|uniref:DUF2946 domain-containing protein n=1 Tax=Ideonella dechloratans TaxID=36863 RepID=A0A643FCE2_IDEDE|nr:hypothetical protein [Ideonella dechloratans]KAB0577766.1 hypothetical protein F7Q92_15985 [Ideonella dechloratans]UFU11976.1 hypothetical protein LRM40_19775 [Ideonella dechloratans]
MTFSRVLFVLLLTLLLPLRGAWAWMPAPGQGPAPMAAAAVAPQEPPCAMHAAASSAQAQTPVWRSSEPASTLCHASAGACCLAVMPTVPAPLPGAMPIVSLRYPPLAVPAPAFFGDPQERPPRSA